MATPRNPARDEEPLSELLRRLGPDVEQVFSSYHLEDSQAEAILQEVVFMMVERGNRIGNRDLWLLAAVRRTCQRLG
jgi:hypothetical protein